MSTRMEEDVDTHENPIVEEDEDEIEIEIAPTSTVECDSFDTTA